MIESASIVDKDSCARAMLAGRTDHQTTADVSGLDLGIVESIDDEMKGVARKPSFDFLKTFRGKPKSFWWEFALLRTNSGGHALEHYVVYDKNGDEMECSRGRSKAEPTSWPCRIALDLDSLAAATAVPDSKAPKLETSSVRMRPLHDCNSVLICCCRAHAHCGQWHATIYVYIYHT